MPFFKFHRYLTLTVVASSFILIIFNEFLIYPLQRIGWNSLKCRSGTHLHLSGVEFNKSFCFKFFWNVPQQTAHRFYWLLIHNCWARLLIRVFTAQSQFMIRITIYERLFDKLSHTRIQMSFAS